MPREFPEEALEAIAAECDQASREWGAGKGETRQRVAAKWARKAAVIRDAIDAYRERVNAPPITRRQKFAALVNGLAEQMTPRSQPVERPSHRVETPPANPAPALEYQDRKRAAAGERE